ncbi:hypothetical protein KOAAANKH_02250 [Brevundimonas sp. NIBR10]|uniref:hypothetical protein n=1 Tax=Brevundimonas sp. NIBR10 TaxID=3015997 RepID=UPI0022F1D4A3|nr:hypothetical protein [Brevundimonas sp. NIBR10]WGM47374.1 hypothetical protein KOAAANKH_02250 [Brevundimonas sp. NIBR10]
MSSDEFDPMIERLFARTPQMPDASLFAADVEAKLASGSRVRTLALTVAGLVGGCIAVRESLNLDFTLSPAGASSRALGQGLQNVSADASGAIRGVMDQFGLADLSLGSMGGMQLFWIATGALVALAAAGVVRLSQET